MIVPNDLTIYSRFADEWWVPSAPRFRSLQHLTPFRLSLIHDFLGNVRGKKIVDLGCGGGLIAVPLLDEGAELTGIDQSAESIEIAKKAANGRGLFFVADVTKTSIESNSADIVILADVLDHVPQFAKALREAARILKPGGKLFVGTLNRTWLSRLLTIFVGESLRLIPPGTHSYNLFITPKELIETAELCGLQLERTQGEWPKIFQYVAALGDQFKTL